MGKNTKFILCFKDTKSIFQLEIVTLYSSPFAIKYASEDPVLLRRDSLVGKNITPEDAQKILTTVINDGFKSQGLTIKSFDLVKKFDNLIYNTNYFTIEAKMKSDQSTASYNIVVTEDNGTYVMAYNGLKDK